MSNLFKLAKSFGYNKLETAMIFGTPIITGLAPPVLVASQANFTEYPIQSSAALVASCLISPFTAYAGIFAGMFGAIISRTHRSEKARKYNEWLRDDINFAQEEANKEYKDRGK